MIWTEAEENRGTARRKRGCTTVGFRKGGDTEKFNSLGPYSSHYYAQQFSVFIYMLHKKQI